MVVSTDQWHAEIGSFSCHSLSKCKWDNNHMFLNIIFIYFLLLCIVLNTKFCLYKFAKKLVFHWKPIIIFLFKHIYCIFVPYCFFVEILNQTLGQEIAKIIYHHLVIGTLIAYQHIALQISFY